MGPGENAGAVDVGDGLAVVVQGREPQPPLRGRALPGRGHRRRRHPARRLRARRAADRGARLAALRRPRHAAHPLPARARRGRHRRLRQLGRRADGRRRDLLRAALRAELPRERDVRRARAARTARPLRGRGARQRGRAARRAHRAATASAARACSPPRSSSEGDDDKRPSVQIGDPLEESKLIECCLELVEQGLLVALQDLGAAGLSSSTSEMASKGGVGLDLDVSRVPLREPDMEPFEIMISESQERMLCVVEPARLDDVLAVCGAGRRARRAIGEVTDTRQLRVFDGDELVGDMPVAALVDECPLYDLEPEEPDDRLAVLRRRRPRARRRGASRSETLPRAARLAERRQPPLGVRAVRLPRRQPHRAPARAGRRRRAAAGARRARHRPRDRGLDRRQRAPGRLRPLHRRGRGGLRVRREPRLRRRRAARPHQLPQLRQPREAARRLAADARRRGDGGRLPRARACRSSAATCPSTTRGPRGRSTRRRSSAWSASCPTRRAPGGARSARRRRGPDMVALIGPFAPSLLGLGAGAAARASWRAGLEPFDLAQGARGARARARGGAQRAPSRSAHDVSDGGLACCVAECAICGRRRRDARPRAARCAARRSTRAPRCSARDRAASSSRARASALLELSREAAGVGFLALGTVGGEAIRHRRRRC